MGGVALGLGRWSHPAFAQGESAGILENARRDRVRPPDRRDAHELHGCAASRLHRQRVSARADASMERRRHGDAARRQHVGRGRVDPLARHPSARQHGRRPRLEFPRHSSGRNLRLQVHRQAGRHVLVSQPLRVPGAAWPLRATRHRPAEARAVQVRPRAHRDAHRLDGRGSRASVREVEEAIRLLQLQTAHGRRLLARRSHAGLQGDGCGAEDVGRDADERRRISPTCPATPTPT